MSDINSGTSSVRTYPSSVVFQLFGQYFMEDSGESDVFSEKDEPCIASDSYDEIEFEDLDLFALYKNADKSDDKEGP